HRRPAVRLPHRSSGAIRLRGRTTSLSRRRSTERRKRPVSHARRRAARALATAHDLALRRRPRRRANHARRLVCPAHHSTLPLGPCSAPPNPPLPPPAGRNAPVNAIESSLSGPTPSSPASIFITLAGTSVGRGWDCVGHSPGTYRNRISISPFPAFKEKTKG